MIHIATRNKEKFETMAKGLTTCGILPDEDYQIGDFLAINETISDGEGNVSETGRSCLFCITDINSNDKAMKPGYVVLSLNPCRIEEHVRLTAAVYGEKEGGSDEA